MQAPSEPYGGVPAYLHLLSQALRSILALPLTRSSTVRLTLALPLQPSRPSHPVRSPWQSPSHLSDVNKIETQIPYDPNRTHRASNYTNQLLCIKNYNFERLHERAAGGYGERRELWDRNKRPAYRRLVVLTKARAATAGATTTAHYLSLAV